MAHGQKMHAAEGLRGLAVQARKLSWIDLSQSQVDGLNELSTRPELSQCVLSPCSPPHLLTSPSRRSRSTLTHAHHAAAVQDPRQASASLARVLGGEAAALVDVGPDLWGGGGRYPTRYLAKALALKDDATDMKQSILMDLYLEILRCAPRTQPRRVPRERRRARRSYQLRLRPGSSCPRV